jgi:hypothetical protein
MTLEMQTRPFYFCPSYYPWCQMHGKCSIIACQMNTLAYGFMNVLTTHSLKSLYVVGSKQWDSYNTLIYVHTKNNKGGSSFDMNEEENVIALY